MSNRETLKEMQARLAQRLEQARSSNIALTWLAVTAGARNYLFPLRQSGEILPAPQLRPVPRTKPWFLGVVNVRGSLFGTVDLANFVAHSNGQKSSPAASLKNNAAQAPSVITFHPAMEMNCALQIDALAGLRSAESFQSSKAAPLGAHGYLGNQFFDAEAQCWQEINLQALSQTSEFLNISA